MSPAQEDWAVRRARAALELRSPVSTGRRVPSGREPPAPYLAITIFRVTVAPLAVTVAHARRSLGGLASSDHQLDIAVQDVKQ